MSQAPSLRAVLTELLELDLNVHQRRIERLRIKELVDGIRNRPPDVTGFDPKSSPDRERAAPAILTYLRAQIQSVSTRIHTLRKQDSEFRLALTQALTDEDRRQLVLSFAAEIGASKRQLRGDAKAFSRWFDADAVTDRMIRRVGEFERNLSFYLERFGVLAAFVLGDGAASEDRGVLWTKLGIEETLRPMLAYDGDSRVSCAAFRSLAAALRSLPAGSQEAAVEESTLQYIYRSAMQTRQDVWIQCEALSLLESLSPVSLVRVLEQRLSNPGPDPDLFLRRRALEVIAPRLSFDRSLDSLVEIASRDPSAFVRPRRGRDRSPSISRDGRAYASTPRAR